MILNFWIFLLVVFLLIQPIQEKFANKNILLANRERPTCKSSYSSSGGFVCLTTDEEKMLHQRGGNRTNDADF
jgi:hypothetical protein